jgi:hypothetical protein
MIEIQIQGGGDPHALAELIASTLHGHPLVDPSTGLAQVGKLVRERQESAERERPSRQELETVNFARIDPDDDWTDV